MNQLPKNTGLFYNDEIDGYETISEDVLRSMLVFDDAHSYHEYFISLANKYADDHGFVSTKKGKFYLSYLKICAMPWFESFAEEHAYYETFSNPIDDYEIDRAVSKPNTAKQYGLISKYIQDSSLVYDDLSRAIEVFFDRQSYESQLVKYFNEDMDEQVTTVEEMFKLKKKLKEFKQNTAFYSKF